MGGATRERVLIVVTELRDERVRLFSSSRFFIMTGSGATPPSRIEDDAMPHPRFSNLCRYRGAPDLRDVEHRPLLTRPQRRFIDCWSYWERFDEC